MTQKERYENEIEGIQKKIADLEKRCKEKSETIKNEDISLRELNLNKKDYLIENISFLGFADCRENIIILIITFEDGTYLRKLISEFEEKYS